ncbi:acyl-CoA dehydrogenase [Streptomyces alkaliterrae]|uniref:Acyl-CoA oxidase n=1 Tax=Streptomyces alkaliterrae TaxID=2213162 RepID=A0A5P0YMJ4_9ACTN|nr:acyl-CoA dehydrogenase [Streptomyces alkaliterrae]MBB1257660.1 acyl-CoA oxidase [Streptomyces alkaliterrae]MQS01491.1 acyl-CoA oxidase [Streptomyces alkaliterrae]
MTLLTFQEQVPPRPGGLQHAPIPPNSATSPTSPTSDAADTTTGDLTYLLFDRGDRERIHGTWRRLISTEEFRYRPGLTAAQRTALSYSRLRKVNDAVGHAVDLADDPYRLASLHEWAGVVDGALGTLAGIHYNLFLGSLIDHGGTDERDLSEFSSMRRTGTFLCTELAHGNDAAALRTTAELDRRTGGFILHTPTPGAQKFMPNTSLTGGPKTALVAARLLVDGEDQGVFLFLTPLSGASGPLPGIRVRCLPERTGSPVDHCLTSFDQVRLPREALLEAEHGRLDRSGALASRLGSRRKRFLRSIGRVTAGKLCMSAAGTGVTRAALAISVRHAHHRRISGPKAGERVPLTAHRSHHGPLLRGLATAYAMTFLHRRVVSRWARHEPADRDAVERLVAVAKGWITWQARAITIECRERCGAQGLFSVNALADFPLNLEGAITAEGDNLVIWLKAAGEMLFQHRAEPSASQHDRPSARDVTGRDLTDPRWLRDLLAEVESLWQNRARADLRRGPAGNTLGRWNAASSAALRMVSAHAQLQAADSFLDAIDQAVDPTARALLHRLCRLFLLDQLAEHTGDLLADGHLTAQHVRALPTAVDAVTAELAPHMTALVDAFDLPAEFLASVPVANSSYIDDFDRLVGGG